MKQQVTIPIGILLHNLVILDIIISKNVFLAYIN